jgi:hypothetical protein
MRPILRGVLVVIAVIGLGIDAYTHFDLASLYSHSATAITQEQLFWVEAIVAILAGLTLIVRPTKVTAGVAFLVAAGGLALLLLYRFVDVGELGPLPNMYEPLWYDEKSAAAWGEAVAATASAALVLLVAREPRPLRS